MVRIYQRCVSVIKPLAIGLFIALNLVIIFTGSLPDRSELGKRIFSFLKPYTLLVGLEQPWAMFAPNPTSLNVYHEAEIQFTDGSKEIWSFPRPTKMSTKDIILGGDRYSSIAERFLMVDRHPEVWTDVARFVLRGVEELEKSGKGRVVKGIQFYRYHNYIAAPEKKFLLHGVSAEYEKTAAFYYYPGKKGDI